jgi:hypothetical protein
MGPLCGVWQPMELYGAQRFAGYYLLTPLLTYGSKGYQVRSSIVRHLINIAPEARSSLGSIRIVEKAAIQALWQHVRLLLSKYRDNCSLDNLGAKVTTAQTMRPSLPRAAWFSRALDTDQSYIGADQLLAERT